MIPPKEKLYELYVERDLTTYEVAEIFQVSRKTVSRWLKKYGVPVDQSQRKYKLIKKVPFTKKQKEFIVGTLLGDGCIALHGKKNKSCRLMIGHCEKQKNLVLDKKAILGNFVNTISKKEDKKKNSIIYSFVTITHNDFKFFRKLFYNKEGKKIIRKELEYYLTPYAIAYWIMDDGSCDGKYSIRLHTSSFTYDEHKLLQNMLKIKFNIKCKICGFTKNDNKLYYLSFNKKNSILLSDLVRKYIIEDMKYKILPLLND